MRTRVARRLAWCLVIALAMLVVSPAAAFAKSYTMGPVNIDATVGTDGSLTVTEDRTYVFDGSFNGVYWDIPTGTYEGRTVSVNVLAVGVVTSSGFQPYTNSSLSSSGNYSVTSTTSSSGTSVQRIKLYSSQRDATVTFRLSYTLTGGVSAWADTGELYWKFVTDGWDEPSSNVTCTVHLPVAAGETVTTGDSGNVRAWGHGPLNGSVSVTGDGASLTLPEVGTDEYAEVRMTFPVSWLAGMTPSSTSKLSSILSQEQTWADEANAKRTTARVVTGVVCGAVLLVSALTIFLAARTRKRYRDAHASLFHDDYFRDVPSNDHPAVLGALLHEGNVTPELFTAALMRLTDEKAVTLDVVTVQKKGLLGTHEHKDYRLTRNPPVADKLADPIDQATDRFLFDDVAPQAKINEDRHTTLLFSSLKQVAQDEPELYSDAMTSWKDKVSAECESRGFFVDKNASGKVMLSVMSVLCVVAGVIGFFFAISVLWLAALLLVAAVGAACFGILVIKDIDPLSPEAVEITAKMKALKRWLLDFTRLKEAIPSDVVLWNKLLVLAVVLGVAKEVIDQLKVVMPELLEDPGFYPTYFWYMGYGDLGRPADMFESAYGSAAQVSAAQLATSSSSSGGGFGGGFSGGGGGGFGGGGGGGAF